MLDYRERKELRDYIDERRLNHRLLIVRVLFALVFVAGIVGVYYLQVVRGEEYERLAESNRLRRVLVRPLRGNMYDRSGRPLVANRTALNVVVDREKLKDVDGLVERLAGPLGMSGESLRERILRYRTRPAFEPAILKEDVGFAEIAYLEARRYEIPEISITSDARRHYPDGGMLAHVVGYVGEATEAQLAAEPAMEMGDIVGRTGLERVYDGHLRGRRGRQFVEVNSYGRPVGAVFTAVPPEAGSDLYLSLDHDLQKALVEGFGEEAGAGVFLDVRTGEVLAITSQPSFDPNLFATRFNPEIWRAIGADPRHPLQNRVIASTYSPGSTFKLAVAVAALEEGLVDEKSVVGCSGGAVFYGRRFGCWKKGGHGGIGVHRALVQSCNVYFYTVGRQLGIERIARYARMLGFGEKSGIDLPGERNGIVPSPEWKRAARNEPWYAGETISVAIGQGPMLVTAVQMADMAASIANGGKIHRPRVARPGPGMVAPPEVIQDAHISQRTLATVRRAMWGVVHESGTGGRARLPNVAVVGKTGTVQVYKASAGVDSDKLSKEMRDHAWFVGYAPLEAPEVAFAVFVEHGGHGGSVSAPIVRSVLTEYFKKDRRPGLGPLPPPDAQPAAVPLVTRAATAP